jgi:hypothetical protein
MEKTLADNSVNKLEEKLDKFQAKFDSFMDKAIKLITTSLVVIYGIIIVAELIFINRIYATNEELIKFNYWVLLFFSVVFMVIYFFKDEYIETEKIMKRVLLITMWAIYFICKLILLYLIS